MSLEVHWQLPACDDARYGDARPRRRGERDSAASPFQPGVSDPRGARFNFFDYVHQVARAVELSGFDGAHIPHDPLGDEAWIIAAYVARGTRKIELVTSFEASWGSSVYAAKNAASFQRFTGGRLAWHILAGPSAAERRIGADPVSDDDLLPRLREFLQVARGVLTQAPFSFKGRFFEVLDGGFKDVLAHQRVPTIYLAGDSTEARELSAEQADVHVFSPAPAAELRAAIAELRRQAQARGRTLRFGLRVDVLARDTDREAFRDADRIGAQLTGAAGALDEHDLWEGPTTSATGAAASLVGSYDAITKRLADYADAGVDVFLLGALPRLEEAYRFGAHVLPRLRARVAPRKTSPQPIGAIP